MKSAEFVCAYEKRMKSFREDRGIFKTLCALLASEALVAPSEMHLTARLELLCSLLCLSAWVPPGLLFRGAMSGGGHPGSSSGDAAAMEKEVNFMLEKIADMCQSREKEQATKLEDWAKELAAREAAVASREAAVALREAEARLGDPPDRVSRGLCESCGVGICSRSSPCFDKDGRSTHHHNCHDCYKQYKSDKRDGRKGTGRSR